MFDRMQIGMTKSMVPKITRIELFGLAKVELEET